VKTLARCAGAAASDGWCWLRRGGTYLDFSPDTSAIDSQYSRRLAVTKLYSHMMAACRGSSVVWSLLSRWRSVREIRRVRLDLSAAMARDLAGLPNGKPLCAVDLPLSAATISPPHYTMRLFFQLCGRLHQLQHFLSTSIDSA
jgi:hypothetical protein